jgi:hypothetical protein
MPTPRPCSPLALRACAVEEARSLEKRERENTREGERHRQERRPAAAKGSTQGLGIAELEEEQETRVLLVKQKHIIMEVQGRVMTHRRGSHMA